MERKKIYNTKAIVGTAFLLALEVVLQLIGSLIPTGVNLNLSLIPITLGAIIYGPISGGFLGLACGAIILLSPNTVTLFMGISPAATISVCLLKTGLAGLLAGFISKLIKKKNDVLASIIAAFIVPFVNTGLFVIFTYLFFMEGLGLPNFGAIFTVLIGINFIFEIVSNLFISPTLYKLLYRVKGNTNEVNE